MTDLVSCPACGQGFLIPPDPCPACGAPAPRAAAPDPSRRPDTVVSSRLNRTAAIGGVMLAGLLTASASWFVVSEAAGTATLLGALLVSALLLWKP